MTQKNEMPEALRLADELETEHWADSRICRLAESVRRLHALTASAPAVAPSAHTQALRTIAEFPATDMLLNMDAANMRLIAEQALADHPSHQAGAESYEHRHAVMESHRNAKADEYFKARHEMLDTLAHRRLFEAGFERGWDERATSALRARGAVPAANEYAPLPEPGLRIPMGNWTNLATVLCYTAAQMRAYADLHRGGGDGWMPIETAPKDGTVVDLWAGERIVNMRRVDLGDGNVFYAPVESGPSCVRDATHFRLPPAPPTAAGKDKP